MRVAKTSLVNILLDAGHEGVAALIAHSALPDELDTGHHAAALVALGLGCDDLTAIGALLHCGRHEPERDQARRMKETISNRWADLVTTWTQTGS